MQNKTLVIIDGFSFFFRAFHAVRGNLSRTDGLPTNALYGFAQMLTKVVKDIEPDLCCVALDHPADTFRHKLYPAYKGTRPEMDEAMKLQMPYFTPLIEAFGIPALRQEGVEADDIIATLATQYGAENEVIIVSSDKDLLQLLGPRQNGSNHGSVMMLDTMKNKVFDPDAVVEKFGVGPEKVIEVQSLIGDSSDNIPGVPSIGPKTAAQLIQEFGTLENLYANVDAVKRDKLREKLKEFKAQAFLSKQLVTLKRDVELTVTPEDLVYHPDLSDAAHFLRQELEFNTLAKRLNNGNDIPSKTEKTPQNQQESATEEPKEPSLSPINLASYACITTTEELDAFMAKIDAAKICAIDTETTGLNATTAEIVGFSLATLEGDTIHACYVPLFHQQGDTEGADLFAEKAEETPQVPATYALQKLQNLCANTAIKKVGHNWKYDWHILTKFGIKTLENWEDTHLMSFCLSAGKHAHGLDFLSEHYFGHKMIPFAEVAGRGKAQKRFDEIEIPAATRYAAEDADITLRLYHHLQKALTEKPREVYENIEKPLMFTLKNMEEAGILLDVPRLTRLSDEFAEDIKQHEQAIFTLAGKEFNVASPKQLSEVLFDDLGLPPKDKKRSTNVTVLEALAEEEPIAKEILAFRQFSKLRSTYTEALMAQMNPHTNRIHTSYNAGGAATGRFSSSDPNLQNIPIRTEAGRRIRRAFIAKPGHILLAADYSQIELRLLAHFSKSEGLTHAFNHGADIHAFTASKVFDIPLEKVDKNQRRVAKILNFGLIYGMGAQSVAKQLEISKTAAQDYISRFFERYDGVKDYMEENKEFCREHGYVETLMGRRIHLPAINSTNGGFRAGAERAAINAPLQGSNADIIKLAMPKIEAALKAQNFNAQMLLQVHDELVFEVPEAEVTAVSPLIQGEMETIVQLSVPLRVDVGTGKNWEDAH